MLHRFSWLRLILGTVFLLGTLMLAKAATGGGGLGPAILAATCLVAMGICYGSMLVKPASKPFVGFVDRVYFGESSPDEKPPTNLRLIRAYRSERCFEKCVEECERQLEDHPLTPDLWAELLLAHRASGNRAAEAATLDQALNCLGMSRTPVRFAKIVQERDNLTYMPEKLYSQFDR
ncbi:MAG: hypothetical protein JWM59_2790 [Verrucomicrobiales bacterium]|nr:hypothetical protein [Verrucomicrobiales bacterium]